MALLEFPWFAQLLGQGPTYTQDVGWALAQNHCKYHGNTGRTKHNAHNNFLQQRDVERGEALTFRRRVPKLDKRNVILNILLDGNPLLNLTFNCYCLFSSIINALNFNGCYTTSESTMLIQRFYKSEGAGMSQSLDNLSGFLADFITVMNAYMDQAPILANSFSESDSRTVFAC